MERLGITRDEVTQRGDNDRDVLRGGD